MAEMGPEACQLSSSAYFREFCVQTSSVAVVHLFIYSDISFSKVIV